MKRPAKLLSLVCALMLCVLAFAGCAPAPSATPAPTQEPTAEPSANVEPTQAPEGQPQEDATPAPEGGTPYVDAIKARGQLILGTESTYPPFEFIIMKDGKSVGVGMDVSLAERIAEKLGVTLVTSEMAFDSLIPALQAGTIDIAASMTPSAERREVIDFSDLYYDSVNCFIVRKGEEGNFTAKESFDGKTIGAQMGTVQNTLVTEDLTNAKNLILPKVSTLIQELKTGNIDAICVEGPVADTYVAANAADLAVAEFKIPDEEGGGVAVTMNKGHEDLMAVVNEVIAEMKASGDMQKIYDEAVNQAIGQIGEDE